MESLTKSQQDYIARTKMAREFAKKKHKEVADAIGVDRPTYTNYEKRRPMPQKYIAKFCSYTGVTEQWLLTGHGSMKRAEYMQAPTVQMAINEHQALSSVATIPLYDALVSAGPGSLNLEPQIIEHIEIPRSLLRRLTATAPRHLAFVQVVGDSMMPTLYPDDLVLVDLSSKGGTDGGIYVVADGDPLMVKELRINPPNVTLISHNPSYKPVTHALRDLNIIGRVVKKVGAL